MCFINPQLLLFNLQVAKVFKSMWLAVPWQYPLNTSCTGQLLVTHINDSLKLLEIEE